MRNKATIDSNTLMEVEELMGIARNLIEQGILGQRAEIDKVNVERAPRNQRYEFRIPISKEMYFDLSGHKVTVEDRDLVITLREEMSGQDELITYCFKEHRHDFFSSKAKETEKKIELKNSGHVEAALNC